MGYRFVVIAHTFICFAFLKPSTCFSPIQSQRSDYFCRRLLSTCEDGDTSSTDNDTGGTFSSNRRSILSKAATVGSAFLALSSNTKPAEAALTEDTFWPLWPALPVAPYSKRRTIRYEVGDGVWAFDQLIGIYYVHVPIRMTVVKKSGGLLVFAPIAPTRECLSLLQELIDANGPITDIILPSVAVEHK
jgi:hypothetical protein